jgi:SRSO17 transposase
MVGQLIELKRKSIEPIALPVGQTSVRSMQRAVSGVFWDEGKILAKHRRMGNEDTGDPNGVLLFDESGFLKQGADSVGVAKQYCGGIGKVENPSVST